MPATSSTILFLAPPAVTTGSMTLFKGRLKSVAIERSTTAITSVEAFMRIGLQQKVNGGGPVMSILASGYVGNLADLSWTGDLNLESDFQLFWFGYSFSAFQGQIGVLTELV